MKQRTDTTASGAEPAGAQRRRVQVFVILHLAAVGIIYAIAATVGGGFSGPPMPPITAARPSLPVTPGALAPASELATTQLLAQPPLPDWTSRHDIPAPWEAR